MKKPILLLFSLFLLIFSCSFVSLIDFGVASTPARATFTAQHLSIVAGDFQGSNTWGTSQQIHSYVGGEDLYAFNNLGMISYDPETNKILYKAQVEVGFEVIVYSTVNPTSMDPGFSANKLVSEEFLRVDKYDVNWNSGTNVKKYYVNYYGVDFDIINTHFYSGYFPLTVGIKNTIGFGGIQEIGGYTFEMPGLEYDILDIKLMSFQYDHIGTWNNEYINYNPTTEGRLTIESVTQETADSAVMNYVNSRAKIGWQEGALLGSFTQQNYIASGSFSPTSTPGAYRIQVGLQPEVTVAKRGYSMTKASMWWDYHDFLGSPAGMGFYWGPSTSYNSRVIGININNLMEHFDFRGSLDLYMTVEPDHILSTSELQEPFFAMGDWVWDASLLGDVPTLAEDTTSGLGDFTFIYLILGVILVVAIAIIMAKLGVFSYISRKINKKR